MLVECNPHEHAGDGLGCRARVLKLFGTRPDEIPLICELPMPCDQDARHFLEIASFNCFLHGGEPDSRKSLIPRCRLLPFPNRPLARRLAEQYRRKEDY